MKPSPPDIAIIDPKTITAPPGTVQNPFCSDQSEAVKQKFLFTCITVAGKKADAQQRKVDQLLNVEWAGGMLAHEGKVFGYLQHEQRLRGSMMDTARAGLGAVKMGQYRRITSACRNVMSLHLLDEHGDLQKDIDPAYLQRAVGPKTARMFLAYAVGRIDVAVLDTHILRWLRECGVRNVPKSSPPPGALYNRLEEAFLRRAKNRAVPPAVLDFSVWKHYSDRTPYIRPQDRKV